MSSATTATKLAVYQAVAISGGSREPRYIGDRDAPVKPVQFTENGRYERDITIAAGAKVVVWEAGVHTPNFTYLEVRPIGGGFLYWEMEYDNDAGNEERRSIGACSCVSVKQWDSEFALTHTDLAQSVTSTDGFPTSWTGTPVQVKARKLWLYNPGTAAVTVQVVAVGYTPAA